MHATALVAEDEPLLAAQLVAELATAWPELAIVAQVGDGEAALAAALRLRPQVLLLDIRMPGMSGIEVVEAIGEDWPAELRLPLVVFITAYDQYAVSAFEHAAVDYLLKPLDGARLAVTCTRLKTLLSARSEPSASGTGEIAATLSQLRALLAAPGIRAEPGPRLTMLQAGIGNAVHLVPVADVVYLEAADKYVRVVTASRDYLLRMPLRQLFAQLDPQSFWQVHRGLVVRAEAIATAVRDESGRVELTLKGRPEKLAVSRLHALRFRGM